MPPTAPTPTPARTGAGCLIVIAMFATPIVVGLAIPGPWWIGVCTAITAGWVCIGVGSAALTRILKITDAIPAPGAMPGPGPDDPVHYIDHADRDRGCTLTHRHDPHPFFWRADMPYSTYEVDGTLTHHTQPVSGRKWCGGVQ